MSRRAQLIVLTNAVAGRDEDFNAWYDGVHLGEVCDVPGVSAARRSDAVDAPDAPAPHRHLAIYDIEADDPAAVVREIQRRYQDGEMTRTDTLADDYAMSLFEQRTPAP